MRSPSRRPAGSRGPIRGEERHPDSIAHLRPALDPDLGHIERRSRIGGREQEAQVVVGAQLSLGEAVLLGQPQDPAQGRRRFDEPAEDLQHERLGVHGLGDLGHHVEPLRCGERPFGPFQGHLRLLAEHVSPRQLGTDRDHRRLALELRIFLGGRPQYRDGGIDLAGTDVGSAERGRRAEQADSLPDGSVALDRVRQVRFRSVVAARLVGGVPGPLQELRVLGAVGADGEGLLEIGQGKIVRMEC